MKKILAVVFIVIGAVSLYALAVLNNETSSLFSGSGNCQACHESDGIAMSVAGNDVSPVTLWRSTMMAHSAKDPLWRAVVSEESHSHPDYAELIESTCTRCHSPMGNRQAREDGSETFTLSDLYADKLAQDGVSCTACHQIKNSEFESASSYSGMYEIAADRKIYGPYEDPLTMPMQNNVNYTPEYRKAIAHSELCATCHTLFAPYFDSNDDIAGTFPEQTPYIEWKISDYPQEGKSCQECHMPSINEGVDIATTPAWHNTLRAPFWKHDFVGGNSYMLGILKNMEADGAEMSAGSAHFDNTIDKTNENLRQAANLTMSHDNEYIRIDIENLTGHKLPTGIPFRRMWLQVMIKDSEDVMVYESGTPTENGLLLSNPNETTKHRDTILSQNDIQIWEATPADVDGNPTFALLKASSFIKDNRIPPKGFDRSSPSYDTCAVYGDAIDDSNFGVGGKDIVFYKMPELADGSYTVSVNLLYQTVKPGLVQYLKDINTQEITDFVKLYDDNPNVPAVIAAKEMSLEITDIEETEFASNIYYSGERLHIISSADQEALLIVSDMNGRVVMKQQQSLIKGANYVNTEHLYRNAAYIAKIKIGKESMVCKFIR